MMPRGKGGWTFPSKILARLSLPSGPCVLPGHPRGVSWALERVIPPTRQASRRRSVHRLPCCRRQSRAFPRTLTSLRRGNAEAPGPRRASHRAIRAVCSERRGPSERSTPWPECPPTEAWSVASALQGLAGQAREFGSSTCNESQKHRFCREAAVIDCLY